MYVIYQGKVVHCFVGKTEYRFAWVPNVAVLWEFFSRLYILSTAVGAYFFLQMCLVKRKKVKNIMKLLPLHYFKLATLLYYLSHRVLDPHRPYWIFGRVTADYSFPDFHSPFPVPRSPFPVPRSPFPVSRCPLPAARSLFLVLVTCIRAYVYSCKRCSRTARTNGTAFKIAREAANNQ